MLLITRDFRVRAAHLPLVWKHRGLERALRQTILTQLFYSKYTSYWGQRGRGRQNKTKNLRGKRRKMSPVSGNS